MSDTRHRSGPTGPQPGPAASRTRPSPSRAGRRASRPSPSLDDLVSTRHTIRLGRRTLAYTATAGRVVLREERLTDGVYHGRPRGPRCS